MDTPAISPVPIAERIAAIAEAGYCGFGLVADDLAGLITLLRDKEFDGPWGVEILSTSFRRLPVPQAVKVAADSARAAL